MERDLADIQLGREALRNDLVLHHNCHPTVDEFLDLHFCSVPVRFLQGPTPRSVIQDEQGGEEPALCHDNGKVEGSLDVSPALFTINGQPLFYKGSKPDFLHVNPPAGPYLWNVHDMSILERWAIFLKETGLRLNRA